MDKIKVTQLQRDNALYARDVMWPGISPEKVVPGLRRWVCGTQACFGGWCAVDPHFVKQGVYPREASGSPAVPSGDNPAAELFGHCDIFEPAGCFIRDYSLVDPTAHEIVTHRLNWLIENSEVTE